jgi:transcriptional regulator with XRE-family HTH domain
MKRQGDADLARNISTIRQQRGLSLADVAHGLGVKKSTIWHYEHGTSRPPGPRLRRLASVLSCSVADLFGEQGTGREPARPRGAILVETLDC